MDGLPRGWNLAKHLQYFSNKNKLLIQICIFHVEQLENKNGLSEIGFSLIKPLKAKDLKKYSFVNFLKL